MKNLFVFIFLILSASNVFARDVELRSGQSVLIGDVMVRCGGGGGHRRTIYRCWRGGSNNKVWSDWQYDKVMALEQAKQRCLEHRDYVYTPSSCYNEPPYEPCEERED